MMTHTIFTVMIKRFGLRSYDEIIENMYLFDKERHDGSVNGYNRSIILNFSENGNHGCRFNCPFCSWKNQPDAHRRLVPINEDLEEFLKDFHGPIVTLSGGGDPLYNFDSENKNDLKRIIDFIHSKQKLVEIITKEKKIEDEY